jgi:hypothetical protein
VKADPLGVTGMRGSSLDRETVEAKIDHSAEIVDVASTRHGGLRLHVVDVRFPPPWAHVGSARRLAMERALNIGGPHSVLFSTDADAAPAADWIEASLRSISAGADLVGGHIIGDALRHSQARPACGGGA